MLCGTSRTLHFRGSIVHSGAEQPRARLSRRLRLGVFVRATLRWLKKAMCDVDAMLRSIGAIREIRVRKTAMDAMSRCAMDQSM
jgi:hypothetical protein